MIGRVHVLALSVSLLAIASVVGPVSAAPGVSYDQIVAGYKKPVFVTHAGRRGEIFVVEQGGRIERIVRRRGRWTRAGTFLNISDLVNEPGDQGLEVGLLGLAFDPRYRKNGRFYVAYTRKAAGARDRDSVISEFRRRNRSSAKPGSERIVMVVEQPLVHVRHVVANLAFGPDGMLYIGSGDGGPLGDPDGHAQDLESHLGKILRIDPRDPDGRGPKSYRIPSNNPYVGRTGRDEIWSSGLRNPWRFSFDRKTGDLWIGDTGQDQREEVDRARAVRGRGAGRGLDFGWNDCEGTLEFADDEGDADQVCEHDTLPIFDYAHSAKRCAIIGGHVYRGPQSRGWRGLYVAPDFCGSILVLDRRGRLRYSRTTDRFIVSMGEDAAGRIFAVDRNAGAILRVRLGGPRPRA